MQIHSSLTKYNFMLALLLYLFLQICLLPGPLQFAVFPWRPTFINFMNWLPFPKVLSCIWSMKIHVGPARVKQMRPSLLCSRLCSSPKVYCFFWVALSYRYNCNTTIIQHLQVLQDCPFPLFRRYIVRLLPKLPYHLLVFIKPCSHLCKLSPLLSQLLF